LHVPPPEPEEPEDVQTILPTLAYAFAPLHKLAFGVATGAAAALFMACLTVGALALPTARSVPIELIGQYFTGYHRNWSGVLVGAAWGFGVAFIGGWFFAFCRNLVLAVTVFIIQTRAELTATKGFLDHI
jgi:hypothetical protein